MSYIINKIKLNLKFMIKIFSVGNLNKFASKLIVGVKREKKGFTYVAMGAWFLDPMTSYGEAIIVLYHQISSVMFIVALLVLTLLVLINNAHGRFDRDYLKFTVRMFVIVYKYIVIRVFSSFSKLNYSKIVEDFIAYFALLSYMRFNLNYYDTILQQIRMHELVKNRLVADMHLEATEFTTIEYIWSSAPVPVISWMVTASTSVNYSQDGLTDPVLSIGSEGSQWSWDYDFAISFNYEVPLKVSYFTTMWVFQDDAFLIANSKEFIEYKNDILNVVGNWIDDYLYNNYFFDFITELKEGKELSKFFDTNLGVFKGFSGFGDIFSIIFFEKNGGYSYTELLNMFKYAYSYILNKNEVSNELNIIFNEINVEEFELTYLLGYLEYKLNLAYKFSDYMSLSTYEFSELTRIVEATEYSEEDKVIFLNEYFSNNYSKFLGYVLHECLPYDLKYIFFSKDLRMSVLKGMWLNNTMFTKQEAISLFYRFNSALYKVEDEIEVDDIYNEMNIEFNYLRLLSADKVVIVPMDVPLRITSSATDVIHSFALPAAGVKADAIPGRSNELFLTFRRPGMVLGMCSELCGVNHGFMPITFEVLPYEQYLTSVHLGLNKGVSLVELVNVYYGLLESNTVKITDSVYSMEKRN